MNKLDHAIEIKITKDGKEKLFYLPHFCDNQVWFQIFKETTTHSVELVPLQVTFAS